MLNRVILIGRLTRSPEMRYVNDGVAVARFTLAVDRPYTNSNGEREADFIDIVAWRKLAEHCTRYLQKGQLAAVEGRIEVQSYEDRDGNRRRVWRVVAENVKFLDRRRSEAETASEAGQGEVPPGDLGLGDEVPDAEDIPF